MNTPIRRSAGQRGVRCVVMRGGTSKGVYFHEDDLPADPQARDKVLLAVMGSPDPRQIDGLGGADNLTSKIVIVGKSNSPGADVNYTFGQVGIDLPYVSYSANCGNLSAGVGVFAIEEGMVEPVHPVTRVRIFNTNTSQLLVSYVPVDENGAPAVDGDCAIAGVPGTSGEIRMDFAGTKGASTGKLLPSGNLIDELYIPEFGRKIAVSIVDVAKATVFFHARDAGILGTESPEAFTPEILERFWAIRNAAAAHVQLAPDSRLPHPVSVVAPTDYVDYMTKQTVSAQDVSFVARRVGGPPPRLHKAFAATGAVCTAIAANLPGTVVHAVARHFPDGVVRIGHPTGVFPVRIALAADGEIQEASYVRTARRIMEGTVYVRESGLRA
ncbi:2-methylaconitate cis-trans isomerase PrpF family protein [Bordetella sp. BOR01]|uniref:2-methylaconitate cis-trans isomerase PrpF family protein n=1 Tax=Bordetella sp. BOR01 TaxID=2854779 RepID=UPI001C43CD6D|nr:PrpF domain-containing protein [Bordetella sp. BOR01]MBV7482203.1 3-methylitaconate isomerase [Bordetella sp. BOR01]